MCQSMVDIQPAAAEIRRGKQERKIEKIQGKNIMPPSLLHRVAIIMTGVWSGNDAIGMFD